MHRGIYVFAHLGGEYARSNDPYTWNDDSAIVVALDGGPQRSADDVCEVTPAHGADPRSFGASRARLLQIYRVEIDKWFNGPAEVVCPKGRVFLGWSATLVNYYYVPLLLVLPITIVVLVMRRRRQKPRKDKFDPGPMLGYPPGVWH